MPLYGEDAMTDSILKTLSLRKAQIDVADAAADARTLVTTSDVVRLTSTRLEVVRISDPGRPWLTLELVLGIDKSSGTSASLDKSGQVVLTRDGSRVVVHEFDATELGQLLKGKACFRDARDQLLLEVLPVGHPGRLVPGAAPSVPRRAWPLRLAARLGPWLGGASAVVILALLFGPRTANTVAVGDTALTADAASRQLPMSRAPEAWDKLPDEQKRVLMDAAQRLANGVGPNPSSDVAVIVENLARVTPVGATAAGAARTAPLLTEADFKRVKAASQVRMTTGGTTFYAFVDPMCSACQHLETQLQKLDATLNFIAIPVGFQGGGRDQAAAALCAKNKVEAWHKAARVQPVGNKPCEEGYKQVDANNALFLSLGFNATPTLIAPNARIAQGSAQAEQLAAWVTANRT